MTGHGQDGHATSKCVTTVNSQYDPIQIGEKLTRTSDPGNQKYGKGMYFAASRADALNFAKARHGHAYTGARHKSWRLGFSCDRDEKLVAWASCPRIPGGSGTLSLQRAGRPRYVRGIAVFTYMSCTPSMSGEGRRSQTGATMAVATISCNHR